MPRARRIGWWLAVLLTALPGLAQEPEEQPPVFRVEVNILGQYATEPQYRVLREKLRLDDPLLVRYLRWLGVLTGVIEDPLGDPALGLGFDDPRGHRYFGNFGFSMAFRLPVNSTMSSGT